jgi:hypothetical protein
MGLPARDLSQAGQKRRGKLEAVHRPPFASLWEARVSTPSGKRRRYPRFAERSFPSRLKEAGVYISTGSSAVGLTERQRFTATAVKMASAIQMSAKVSICARRNGS